MADDAKKVGNIEDMQDGVEQADRMADAVQEYFEHETSQKKERAQEEVKRYRHIRSQAKP